jgi:hypothetical protein
MRERLDGQPCRDTARRLILFGETHQNRRVGRVANNRIELVGGPARNASFKPLFLNDFASGLFPSSIDDGLIEAGLPPSR